MGQPGYMVGVTPQSQQFVGNPAVRGMTPGTGAMGYSSGFVPQSAVGFSQPANYGMQTQTSLGMWQ